MTGAASIVAVCVRATHDFSKDAVTEIELIEGDAHQGATVQHLHDKRKNPAKPNLRQVHLIHGELLDELKSAGFDVYPGAMGENVTTLGIDILSLPTGTRLHLGAEAVIEVTGLRTPCRQLNGFQDGLMDAVLDRDAEGALVRKSGVMSIVIAGGRVRAGDPIRCVLPDGEHRPLQPV
ncbi:MAG: MOSC domain-containing protein [Alphaproteobacteria bacterium]